MATPVRVLGIVGSLRRASYNGYLLHAGAGLAPPGMSIVPIGLAAIPSFNADTARMRSTTTVG